MCYRESSLSVSCNRLATRPCEAISTIKQADLSLDSPTAISTCQTYALVLIELKIAGPQEVL